MADTKVLFTDAARERLAKTATKHLLKIASKFSDFDPKIFAVNYDVTEAIKMCLDHDSKELIFEVQIKPELTFDHQDLSVPVAAAA